MAQWVAMNADAPWSPREEGSMERSTVPSLETRSFLPIRQSLRRELKGCQAHEEPGVQERDAPASKRHLRNCPDRGG